MRKPRLVLVGILSFLSVATPCQESAPPLKLVRTLILPLDVKGNFDHFGIDLKTNRLFATPEA